MSDSATESQSSPARPAQLTLGPLTRAGGSIVLPGSKSISNRVLLLAALSRGKTRVRDLLDSDDTRVMLTALAELGVACRPGDDGKDYLVQGVGGAFPVREARLFMGNAGTAIRPLTAVLALQGGSYALSGVPRMHERPIGDLVDALRQLGARVDYLGNDGYPPLAVRPGEVRTGEDGGISIQVRVSASSQFLTALLMALPLTGKPVLIEVLGELISKPYIDITLNLMRRFGVEVENRGYAAFAIPAGACYAAPDSVYVEGDASSASYFLAAGAIGGGPVRVEGVGSASIQGDIRFAEALAAMGAVVESGPNWIQASAPASAKLRAVELDCNHIPDAAMTLAMAALFAQGATRLTNIASWRVKETDRIAAMAKELAKLGAAVEGGSDYLAVTPPQAWKTPAEGIDTYDDHRMAMCFSLAAFGPLPLRINDPGCVAKTFPDYFEAFRHVAD
ncbi:MAG: 3-phosphoshikimate 1-carboxyvinyltransferase [Candidatus Protistobacter heckmanni]|nr:3-phosphoshikimate 1-carboxyvinyltransferase [Candidatus Protistobacter heckmanni]